MNISRCVRGGYWNRSWMCKFEGKLKESKKVANTVLDRNKKVQGYGFVCYFQVYTVHTEDCIDYSALYYILPESYSNFMSHSPLANSTKWGSGSGSFCCCCLGCKAAPVAGVIKSEPLGSSSTRWDWAVKCYSGCICATVGQRCQEKLRPFCCSEI